MSTVFLYAILAYVLSELRVSQVTLERKGQDQSTPQVVEILHGLVVVVRIIIFGGIDAQDIGGRLATVGHAT